MAGKDASRRTGLRGYRNHRAGRDERATGRRVVRDHAASCCLSAAGPQLSPARRTSSTGRTSCKNSSTGWKVTQHNKVGQNLKYDMHIFANHGIRLSGIHDERCCNPTCWKATSRTTWTTSHCVISNVKTISFDEVAGKGAKQIGFDQVDVASAVAICGRGRRYHAAAASEPVSAD